MTIDVISIYSNKEKGEVNLSQKYGLKKNGEKDIEVADSELKSSDEKEIVKYIDENWKFLNERITKSFNGEKLRKHGKV